DDDCGWAAVVISVEPLRRQPCAGAAVVIDRFDVWREGAHAVRLDAAGIAVETVAQQQGGRPWSPYVKRRPPWETAQ
ncbi:MAG TPA: hypothetical protein VIS03_13615, partial [Kiloniellaceae bacterium]